MARGIRRNLSMFRNLLIGFWLLVSTAAQAEWHEARSNNFLVYSEGSEQQLRDFTAKLEKFHFILRAMHNITRSPPPNRLHVYLLRNIDAVQHSLGGAAGIAGYSIFHARGPILVGTRERGGQNSYMIDPEPILLHEYSHHFMYGYFPATYPTWYSEGFAEFWGQTQISDTNVVRIGAPAGNRFYSFQGNRWLPIDRILAARSYADARGDVDLIYAEGWLLNRYLFTNSARNGQLFRYLTLINQGRSYEQAMQEAFGGDTGALDSELRRFAEQTQFPVLDVPFRPIDVGPIAVRTLRPAEAALIAQDIQLGQEIPAREAADFARTVSDIAYHYPDDPYALEILIEAQRLAGNSAAATAAADHLLQIEPDNARGLMHKGLLQAEALAAAHSADDAAWDAARQPILRANRSAPNDPLVLEAYYDSFADQGVLPPASAQNAFFHALQLAPGDEELRYRVAADFERRDMIPEAIAVIRPTALALRDVGDEGEREHRRRQLEEERNRPAGQARHETAREMLTRLQTRLAAQPAPATTSH
jgi:hypothetical protein